jgi:hypothetical protein
VIIELVSKLIREICWGVRGVQADVEGREDAMLLSRFRVVRKRW